MSNQKRKITVCGSFGYGNAGDEAIPLSYYSLLSAAGVDCSVSVLSRYGKPDMETVIGTDEKDRIAAIRNQSIVVSGGGIIEQKERATIFRCERFLSKGFTPNIGYIGISVEPGVNYGWAKRKKILKILKQSNMPKIYTRDLLSEITLRNLYPDLDIETIGDLVLWLGASDSKPIDLSYPYIAVSLSSRWAQEPEWYQWIVNELIILAKEQDVSLVFIPMSSKHDDDRLEHQKIAELIKNNNCNVDVYCMEGDYAADDIAAVYRDATLVVSMRLHGCVIAYGQKTPFIGISYHPKLIGFSYTIGLRKCVLPLQAPKRQTEGSYGYSFRDLGLSRGVMSCSASSAIDEQNFSSLEEYKQKSLSTVKLFLAMDEAKGI